MALRPSISACLDSYWAFGGRAGGMGMPFDGSGSGSEPYSRKSPLTIQKSSSVMGGCPTNAETIIALFLVVSNELW